MPGRMRGSKFMTDPQVLSRPIAYLFRGKVTPTFAPLRFEGELGSHGRRAPHRSLYARAHDVTDSA